MARNRIEELLAEFNRISGTGNMRASAALLPEIIMHLVDMIEALSDRVDGGRARDEMKGLLKDFYDKPVVPVVVEHEALEGLKALGIDGLAETTAALAAEGAKADITVTPPKAAKKAPAKRAPKKEAAPVVPVEPKRPARRSKPKA